MTKQQFENLYEVLPNGKVRKKALNFSDKFVRDLKHWLLTKPFDFMVTYRPKATKVTGYNAPKLFDDALLNLPNVTDMLWSLEGDWNGNSNHCHILLGGHLTKSELARALNRNEGELPYFERIKSKEAAIGYVTKFAKTDPIRAFNYLDREKLFHHLNSRYVFDNYKDFNQENFYKHPNHYYHQRAKWFSEMVNGRFS